MKSTWKTWCVVWASLLVASWVMAEERKPQYEFGDIKVAAASETESKRSAVSVALASQYLEHGAKAWGGARKCVSCHTNGIYMTVRPALSPILGQPSDEIRDFFLQALKAKSAESRDGLKKSTNPAQVIYIAAGLAEWDAFVTKSLSKETREALALMLEIQSENGSWGALDCWPPYESDSFHLATVAAMAIGTAPGWLAEQSQTQRSGVENLKKYLRSEKPPHDYSRVLLLWANARLPGLLSDSERQATIELINRHQRADGGWSIRTFASPEAWGRGNRAEKIRAEPDFQSPPSDGHQTGLAIVVLQESGVSIDSPNIQRGIKWLQSNQQESGRWWTRSLNTDTYHFITYSGTAFPLLALARTNSLPAER